MIVAKVGGSLYDWPGLGPALTKWLADQPEPVLLFPGGGEAADVVRTWDRAHSLGEEEAHWLAIRSLSLAAHFLHLLLPTHSVVESPVPGILDPFRYFRNPPRDRGGSPPHTWSVTSDSLALWVAIQSKASKLVLLKSADAPEGDWTDAGYVDWHFAVMVKGASVSVEAVNLREITPPSRS